MYALVSLVFLAFNSESWQHIFWLTLGMLAIGLVLLSVEYCWDSFIAVVALTHLVAYVVGIQFALLLNSRVNGIEANLWPVVNLSLMALVVGMLGMFVGVLFGVFLFKKISPHTNFVNKSQVNSPVWLNVALVASILIGSILSFNLKSYFHSGVCGAHVNLENSYAYGAIGYLSYLAYVGVILQINRYITLRSTRELLIAVALLLFSFAVMLPSGSRSNTIIILVITFIFYISNEPSNKRKSVGAFLLATLICFSILLGKYYRNNCNLTKNIVAVFEVIPDNPEIKKNFNVDSEDRKLEKLVENNANRLEIILSIFARRLSDGIGTGYLISVIPKDFPHMGTEGLDGFPKFMLPTFMRGGGGMGEYNYAADAMLHKYKFREDIGGSSPIMLAGELYERFSWFGIFLGFMVLGVVLRFFDLAIKSKSVFSRALWGLMIYGVFYLYSYSLLPVFILFTKQLFIFLAISFFLQKIVDISCGASGVSKRPITK